MSLVQSLRGHAESADIWPNARETMLTAAVRIEVLEAALRKAIQLASIACDWNLEEVEIDSGMVSTYDLANEFRTLAGERKE